MKTAGAVNLPELVRIQMHKESLDELSRLDKWEKLYLAEIIDELNPETPTLSDWNELLDLLLGKEPADSEASARSTLVSALSGGKLHNGT